LTVEEAHKISTAVESMLKENVEGVTDVVVHLEEPLELSSLV
jgi:divalent metal cation (Fe/Co/Zn/Cd) transporter